MFSSFFLFSSESYGFGCRSKIENELLTKKRGKFLYCSSLRDREDKKEDIGHNSQASDP